LAFGLNSDDEPPLSVLTSQLVAGLLLIFGSACLIIVVLTHVAEAFHILPSMGWGLPNSAGHYLNLVSAILGCTLLPLGILSRRRRSNKAVR
jgi:hypothetical protein